MKLHYLGLMFAIALSSVATVVAEDAVSMFDGKSLKGWTQKNGTATYRVEDNCIVGKTNEGSPNSFLCSDKEYGDFEMEFEVKVDDALNSGVQIRSASKADYNNFRVHGPQVEISTDGKAGYVYGEALDTGWLSADPQNHTHFKNGEWNKYKIVAKGKSIKTWLNGQQVADLVDERSKMSKGFIGLQVHGIAGGTGPFEVRWRNLTIKELK